jgi:outer membrane protein TolC
MAGWTDGVVLAAESEKSSLPPTPELRLSLRNAMKVSVEQNPTVQLSRQRIKESRAVSVTQLGTMLPNFSGNATAANRRFFLGNFGGIPRVSDDFDFYGTRAFITQNLLSMSLIQRWQASRAGIEVAEYELEATKRDTMATVALIYFEALGAEAAVKARRANVLLNRELLRLATERKAAGMATSLDVTRAKVQLENERIRFVEARTEMGRSKLNLIRAMGIPFEIELLLTDELKLIDVPSQTPEDAMLVAMANRVELEAQSRRQRLANLTLSSVKSERLPSLSGSGDVGLVGLQPGDVLTTHNLELLLSIPIFDGGQREGRISQSRSQVRQEDIRAKDLRFQVTLEVREALLTLESAKQQVAVAEVGRQQALLEVELARERFAVGVATNIEVTNAQTSLAIARDNVIQALFRFNASRVNLARAQGRMQDL